MSASNYSHQLKVHQVHDLEDMSRDLDTLSDTAYTIWHALKAESGDGSITGCQFDLGNRLFDLSKKLEKFTAERAAESEGLAAQSELVVVGGGSHG